MARKKRSEMTPEQLERRRECEREKRHRWCQKNKEKAKKQSREASRRYRAAHREQLREKDRERYDPEKRRAWRDKWYVENYDKVRAGFLRRNYGMTLDEYDAMLASQDGCCAVCDRTCNEDDGSRLCVDHDHKTGKVRGLLCREHNRMLGENVTIEILARLIEYLSKQV